MLLYMPLTRQISFFFFFRYNKVRDADTETSEPDSDRMNQVIALTELVTCSEEARMDTIVAPVFVLADMAAIYTTWMEQLGTVVTRCVHSRKMKYQI